MSHWGDRSDDAPVVELSPRTRRVLAVVAWLMATVGPLALIGAIVWGQP